VAERRVLKFQAKLHRWAAEDPLRRFDDLNNLVCDPAFLLTGWMRVRSNKGARTAGVDGVTAHHVEDVRGLEGFLAELRAELKARTFRPLPVRQRGIPKAGGKVRYLGINTIRDRVVQASLKLVLEPIFEADFLPCSYGFRPKRRAHDAIAESHYLASRSYEWVVEGDIEGCFDNIGHTPVLERMRARVGDKRVMDLVKAFLKAGILTEDSGLKESRAGAPQGGILSPVIANIALSVLDEAIAAGPGGPNATRSRRAHRRATGKPNYRICRYADDFLVLVAGTREDAIDIRAWVAEVLSPMGLRLSPEKTKITHIDEGSGLPRMASPASPEEGHQSGLRLHLPVQEGPRVGQGQGAGRVPTGHQFSAGGPAAPPQSGAQGLDCLLPLRCLARHVPIPAPFRLATGHQVAAAKVPPEQLEGTAPPLLWWTLVARHGRGAFVRSREGADHSLPLPGDEDPLSVAQHRLKNAVQPGLVERPLLGNGHGGCGGRPGETGWSQGQHRAPGRPYSSG
jgi:group II intron reverse transcriptase/maturase